MNKLADRKWEKLIAISPIDFKIFSECFLGNDLNSAVDWKWVNSTSFSFLDQSPTMIWIVSSTGSEWNPLRFLALNKSPFPSDRSSTMIRTDSSIESERNHLLFLFWINGRGWSEDSSWENWVRFTSWSLNECFPFLDLSLTMIQRLSIDRKWVKFTSVSVSESISPFSRSIIDNDPSTLLNRMRVQITLLFLQMKIFPFLVLSSAVRWKRFSIETEWDPPLFLSSNQYLNFSDQPSTMIWTVSSIESKFSQLLFFIQMNLWLFPRSSSPIDSGWHWLLSLQMESLSFPDLSSTMIRTVSSIESEWNPLLVL